KIPYELLRGRKPTLDCFRVFGSKFFILNTKDYLIKFDPKTYKGVFLGYAQNSKAYIILNKHTRKIKESLNVTFGETPPPSKTSPLVDDDLDEEEAINVAEKKILENDIEDETLKIEKIVNIKESRNHPLENVIGNLNQRTLRPDIMFIVCLCSRFQEAPKTSHLEEGYFVVKFVIQNKSFSLTFEEFGHILKIPFEGHVSYNGMWSLDYLAISTPSKDLYKTIPPSPRVIKSVIQTPRQGGHPDHVPVCLYHMLYCIETSNQYNLAFFILKRMERTRSKPKKLLSYGLLLTRFFNHVASNFLELAIDRYILYARVIHPLAPHYVRKTRSDHGIKICRDSNPSSSSTALNHSSASHHLDENVDENDEESSNSSTPSLPQLINSMSNVIPRFVENLPLKVNL
nr:retrovirus-related Pol polyprotein from transposon TNT 1-94 [Tanacetum cinerariifolium]